MTSLLLAILLLLPNYTIIAAETTPQPKKFHPYSLILPTGIGSFACMLAAIISAHSFYDYDTHYWLGVTSFSLATIHTGLAMHAYMARKKRLEQAQKEATS